MAAPIIFSGRRSKLLTPDGLLKSNGALLDNDGVKNYITNGHGEINTAGWIQFNDAPATRPTTGSAGGAGLLSIASSATTPLSGTKNLVLTKSIPTSSPGSGVSFAFTIDAKDKAKMLQISFDCILQSGTFTPGTSTTISDLMVGIIDVTNSIYIEPSNSKLFSNSTTLGEKFSGSFQTSSNSTSYRLCIFDPGLSLNTYSLQFTNLAVSPSVYVYSPVVTDWVSFTPTGSFITFTTYSGKYRRVGDSVEVQTNLAFTGTPGATSLDINLPPGLTIDTTKIPVATLFSTSVDGVGTGTVGTATKAFQLIYNNTTSLRATYQSTLTGSITSVNESNPAVIVSGNNMSFTYRVPIQGWSSNTQVSDGYDGRELTLRMTKTDALQSIPNGTSTKVTFNNTVLAKGLAWDSTNSRVVCVSAGTYAGEASLQFTAAGGVNAGIVRIHKNGSLTHEGRQTVGSGSNAQPIVSFRIDLIVGDYLEVFAIQGSGAALTVINEPSGTFFAVSKLSGSQTISASEEISLRYTSASGQTIPLNSYTTYLYGNKDFDSHGSYNSVTGEFKPPSAARYRIKASIAGTYSAAAHDLSIGFFVNGATKSQAYNTVQAGTANYIMYEDTFNLLTTDILTIRVYESGAAGAARADGSYNVLTIERV